MQIMRVKFQVYAGRNEFSFEQAVNNCALYDANPASVHSALEMQYWLGGRQQTPEDAWYWLDGTPFDYFKWAGGEPNGIYGPLPLCVLSNYFCCGGYWYDNSCAVVVYGTCSYICKKAPPQLRRRLIFKKG
ncbi:unnamed protein product [Toxocara canis]|uniref:C-type lectin domain-containing protein n=1 Tax=Toxocara canis TaxID=6265 RepID=A0A183U029_TOXCA|nr:unnamed protein product [Toxocara canis]